MSNQWIVERREVFERDLIQDFFAAKLFFDSVSRAYQRSDAVSHSQAGHLLASLDDGPRQRVTHCLVIDRFGPDIAAPDLGPAADERKLCLIARLAPVARAQSGWKGDWVHGPCDLAGRADGEVESNGGLRGCNARSGGREALCLRPPG